MQAVSDPSFAHSSLQSQRVPLNKVVIASAITASLGGLLFGFDTAVISGVTKALTVVYDLNAKTFAFTVAVALWGTLLGAAVGGFFGDRFGRRTSLRLLAGLFIVSAAGCAFAWSWGSFVVFRFLAGVAIGSSSVVGPMYIAEIAPAWWRGRMVALFQLNIVFGIVVAYASNYIIGTMNFGATEWRWKLGVSAVPAVFFLVMLYRIPRSPRWLMKQGLLEEARRVLGMVAPTAVEDEFAEIRASLASDEAAGSQPLFSRRFRKPVILAILLALFNQLSCINPILYYLNDIFASAGFGKTSADLQALAVGGTNMVFTIVAMTVIDKFGRKKLLLIGSVGTCVCLGLMAWIKYSGQFQNLFLIPLMGFVAFFAVSQGSVIWVYISEIFPNSVRGKGQSLGSFTHWFACATMANLFPIVLVHSPSGPYFFCSAMMVVQFIVVARFFPETRGYTLEQLQEKLETV
jgi:sugar porter (SP) family MFS transporter